MLYLTPILTSLAYMMGERSVVTATIAPRTDFIQSALEDCYHAFPWKFAQRTAILVPTSGVASMPATFDYEMEVRASYMLGTQVDMVQIDVFDKGNYSVGDNVFWITSSSEGVFQFNTYETQAAITIIYQSLPPVLDAAGTIGTAYPNKATIVKGARVYVKLAQNPDADVSQEESQFDKALANDIATYSVPAPRRKHRSVAQPTGDF